MLFVAALPVLLVAGCGEGGDGAREDATRTGGRAVEHALGETEVPQDPRRVVVLHPYLLAAVLSFGVEPAGATE